MSTGGFRIRFNIRAQSCSDSGKHLQIATKQNLCGACFSVVTADDLILAICHASEYLDTELYACAADGEGLADVEEVIAEIHQRDYLAGPIKKYKPTIWERIYSQKSFEVEMAAFQHKLASINTRTRTTAMQEFIDRFTRSCAEGGPGEDIGFGVSLW